MPISNLNNTHLTAEELKAANDSLTALEEALKTKVINLSAEERQRYGSVNEQNKLFVNKVFDYAQGEGALRSPDVNWDEFGKDYASRAQLEQLIARIERLHAGLVNAKTLHDFDNFQAALDDYAYTSYKAGASATGYETKRNALKQFFARSKKEAIPSATPRME